jgi:hypothetical protein
MLTKGEAQFIGTTSFNDVVTFGNTVEATDTIYPNGEALLKPQQYFSNMSNFL